MFPFSQEDVDVVTTIALENTAGVTPHVSDTGESSSWIVAALQVTGPWECRVEIAIDAALAETLTRIMWDQDTVTTDDMFDAVGEIANVVAGGVKGMTPSPGCGLTLPTVVSLEALSAPTSAHIRRFFTAMSLPLSVTLEL